MTLYEIVGILKQIALTQPNVKSATDGSIYDVMNATNSVKYDVVHLSQTKHITDEETDTYGFNIFYVSRLEDSLEDNRLQIQSIGKEVLDNILRTFCENWNIDYPEIIFYPFTQKFADLCAGCYCRVEIEVPKDLICADDYIEEVAPSKGIKLENIKVEIDQNGTREVTPSPGFDGIGKVTIVTDVTGGSCNLEYKEVEYTENGEYTILPSSGYDGLSEVAVSISVPSRYDEGYEDGKEDGINEQKAKLTVTSFTQNDTYTREDGWSAVTVDVPSRYDEGYADGEAAQKAKLSSTSVTENGTYTREDGYSAFTVDVDTVNNQSKTYTFNKNNTQIVQSVGGDYYLYGGEIIRPDSGYTGLDKATISLQANIQDLYDSGYTAGEAAQKAKLSATAFTDNGTYTNADGWSSVTVDSPWRDYFITGITLNIASAFTDIETATTTYSPSSAFTDIYYTSSDPTIAEINQETGVITAKTDGQITVCTIDRLTHMQDCKQVSVSRSSGLVMDVIYNVTSTTEPTVILNARYGYWPGHIVAGRLDDDTPIPISAQYPYTTGFTFPTTGLVRVHYTVIGDTLESEFGGCYQLVSATIPEGITTTAGHLFDGDYQLTGVTLPSTLSGTLMCFMDCTSLTGITIPSGVTKLDYDCFYNCKSLSSVTIPSGITEIMDSCFGYSFDEDVSITAMTFEGTVPPTIHTSNRPYGTPSLGKYTYTFPIYVPAEAYNDYITAPVWEEYARNNRIIAMPLPLTFEIIEAGNIYWQASNSSYTKTIEYRKNNGEWTTITSNTGASAPSISVNVGDVVQFRGDNATYSSGNNVYSSFSGSTAIFDVSGNIMSLIVSENFITATTLESSYTFNRLFSGCTSLTSAENLVLPATTLALSCYASMFSGCTSLTSAPELPATSLAAGCYYGMFGGCTSLTTAPELPATTLASSCYQLMFFNCTSLTTAPDLPATTLAERCYVGMFNGCSSLTTAPELPATTLANYCYQNMFYNCTNLNYIKCLATDISATNCTYNWVYGVSSTGTFVKDANMSSWGTGDSGIPSNWTIVDNS